MRLRFWGVRGSIPVAAHNYVAFGGNTPCIEVQSDGGVIIIDAGTGIRELGTHLQERSSGAGLKLHLLFTHFHWDHIQGLPYFAPLYSPANEIVFHSNRPPETLKAILDGQMSNPHYPISFDYPAARKTFVDISSGPFHHFGVSVRPFALHHPQGGTGYRIESNDGVITHASDLEHGDDRLDKTLRESAQDADVLIYDAQYTPDEYLSKKGWGHSTWLRATQVARECNVKRLILFHHDPSHDDQTLNRILDEARHHFENTDLAREGWEIEL